MKQIFQRFFIHRNTTRTPAFNGWSLLCFGLIVAIFSALNHALANVVLQTWLDPFTKDSRKTVTDYQWQAPPEEIRRICAIIPSSNSSYWFALNYGLVKTANTLGLSLRIYNTNPGNTIAEHSQLVKQCIAHSPHGVILGVPLIPSLYQTLLGQISRPTLVSVGKNRYQEPINATSSVSYRDVGRQLSAYMNARQQQNQASQTVIFPGKVSDGYVNLFISGFLPAIDQQHYPINKIIYSADSYLEIKNQLHDYLNAHLQITTIVAAAQVAEAAVEVLEEMSLSEDIEIITYELSAQVYRDIKRGHIKASISNMPVLQGTLAIDMALKSIAQPNKRYHVSPKTPLIDHDNIQSFDISDVFAPYGYREKLEVN